MKTYNFIDAVNSGKRFRIVGMQSYWDKCTEYSMVNFNLKQINSQFELEEKTITINESKFEDICNKVCYLTLKELKELKEELGF